MKYRIVEIDDKYIIQYYKDNMWYSTKTAYKTLYAAKVNLDAFIDPNPPRVVYEVEVWNKG